MSFPVDYGGKIPGMFSCSNCQCPEGILFLAHESSHLNAWIALKSGDNINIKLMSTLRTIKSENKSSPTV